MEGNMRYIDFTGSTNAGPLTIDDNSIEKVLSSHMLFARKFDYDRYPEVVKKVVECNQSEN